MKKKLFKTACFLMAVCLLTGTLGLNAYAKKKSRSNYTIGIDAGHQKSGNYSKEPIGPGSSDKKYKVTGGTSGKYSGLPEYRLTLQVAKKLKKELESRGYKVVMTRTKHKVNISNSERAKKLNKKCDIAIRLHADGAAPSAHLHHPHPRCDGGDDGRGNGCAPSLLRAAASRSGCRFPRPEALYSRR